MTMHERRPVPLRLAAGLTLALAAALLTACGTSHPAVRPESGRVTIDLTEFHIAPQTIRATPGPLTLVVRNRGRLPHRFALGRGRTSIGDPPIIPPGGTRVVQLTLPRGHYLMYDALSNYDVLGMEGRVVVK